MVGSEGRKIRKENGATLSFGIVGIVSEETGAALVGN